MPIAATRAGRIHYDLDGDGPPLVLIHELGGSGNSFELLVPQLVRTFRVLRYDQNGCGDSEPVLGPMSMATQAELLLDMIEIAFGAQPCRLTGVAAGAAIAASAALMRPDACLALALCAPALQVPLERQSYLQSRASRVNNEGMAVVADETLDRSYPLSQRRDADAFIRYRATFLATDPASYAAANLAFAEILLTSRLPSLSHPCLCLAGRDDALRPPAEVAALSRLIPGAHFAEINSGHIMPMQAPDEMADQLLDFFRPLKILETVATVPHP